MAAEHGERLAVAEARVENLSREVVDLARDVRALTSAVGDLARSVAVLAEKVASLKGGTPAQIAAVGTGGGAIGGAIIAWLKSMGLI